MSDGFPLRCSERSFRAIARGVVPETAVLTDADWREFYAVIAQALAGRPPAIIAQVSVFVAVLNGWARVRHGRSLSGLPQETLEAFLHSVETARVPIVRKGMWGVRTLVLMGFYARPGVGREIGYRGLAGGWAARTAASL